MPLYDIGPGVAFPAVQAITGSVSVGNIVLTADAVVFPEQIWIAGTVGVSGTVGVNNFPAVQAVSGTVTMTVTSSLPVTFGALPPLSVFNTSNVGVTGSVMAWSQATQGVSGTVTVTSTGSLGVAVQNQVLVSVTGTLPVSIASQISVNNFPTVQAVSGIVSLGNWPAVHGVSGTVQVWTSGLQGISGTVGINNFPAFQAISGGVVVQNWPTAMGVSGTVQVWTSAPQNVSGTVGINNFPATQNISGTVSVTNYPVVQAVSGTISKGTQAAFGLMTQDFKDSGRTVQFFCSSSVSGVLGEALFSMQRFSNYNFSGSVTSSWYATNGKTLRLQSATLTLFNSTAVTSSVLIRMRVSNAAPGTGASVITAKSPSVWSIATFAGTTAGAANTVMVDFPDGLEITNQTQFGFTQQASTTATVFDFNVTGFEY